MIHYQRGGVNLLLNLFRTHGSVFPEALKISIPASGVTALLVLIINHWKLLPYFSEGPSSIMNDNAIWAGFNFLLGFLVVFRTSQAYNRFWEGVTNTYEMGAEWFNCCASLMAFCKTSTANHERVLAFQNTLIRLFSMLHAAALGEIEDDGETSKHDIRAFKMELIDAEGIDEQSLRAVRDSRTKVELIFQWIQQLVVENTETGVLNIPAPILTRSFQEIARGMVHYHDARRLSKIPFPFPYAVTCDCLLIVHWIVAPFVVSQWCPRLPWAMVFSFIQVFTLWSLNIIAVELENPFGSDPNDLDGRQLQHEMNNNLRMLCRSSTNRTPRLRTSIPLTEKSMHILLRNITRETGDKKRSFVQMWEGIEDHRSEMLGREDSGSTLGVDSVRLERYISDKNVRGEADSDDERPMWEPTAEPHEMKEVQIVKRPTPTAYAETLRISKGLDDTWRRVISVHEETKAETKAWQDSGDTFRPTRSLDSTYRRPRPPESVNTVTHSFRRLKDEGAKALGLVPLPSERLPSPRQGSLSPNRALSPNGRPPAGWTPPVRRVLSKRPDGSGGPQKLHVEKERPVVPPDVFENTGDVLSF